MYNHASNASLASYVIYYWVQQTSYVTNLQVNYNVLDAIGVLFRNATNGLCICYTVLNVV